MIEFISTLFSLLFLIIIISPALIILLDYDLIIIPSFIIYSLGLQWAWQFNIIFLPVNIGFNSYCDHYVISSSEYWIIEQPQYIYQQEDILLSSDHFLLSIGHCLSTNYSLSNDHLLFFYRSLHDLLLDIYLFINYLSTSYLQDVFTTIGRIINKTSIYQLLFNNHCSINNDNEGFNDDHCLIRRLIEQQDVDLLPIILQKDVLLIDILKDNKKDTIEYIIKLPIYLWDTNSYILLPIYSFIRLFIYSFDVIHTLGFYSWGIKIDAIPGRINLATTLRLLWKGEYRGKCFELCGQGHFSMILNSLCY